MADNDNLYKPYNRTLAIDTPFSRANFQAQYGGNGNVNAVSRPGDQRVTGPYDPTSPSGTDWNQTFRQNNPYSPSGTDWNLTFGANRQRMNGGIGSPSGTDWSKTFRLAGDTTPPPSPGDIDSTFFGGPTPTPTPTPKPALASSPVIDLYRSQMKDTTNPLTRHDFERYGLGSEFS